MGRSLLAVVAEGPGHNAASAPAGEADDATPSLTAADVPFGRDRGLGGIGIRCGHSVAQFGAGVTRPRTLRL